MARDEDRSAGPPAPGRVPGAAGPSGREARAERLAAQLRANLKRRKEQARGRAETRPAEDGDAD